MNKKNEDKINCVYNYRADLPNRWARRSPFKILQYFAQGKPVIMSNVPAINDYEEGLVYGYRDQKTFISALNDALAEPPNSVNRGKRVELAKESSFERMMERLKEIID